MQRLLAFVPGTSHFILHCSGLCAAWSLASLYDLWSKPWKVSLFLDSMVFRHAPSLERGQVIATFQCDSNQTASDVNSRCFMCQPPNGTRFAQYEWQYKEMGATTLPRRIAQKTYHSFAVIKGQIFCLET